MPSFGEIARLTRIGLRLRFLVVFGEDLVVLVESGLVFVQHFGLLRELVVKQTAQDRLGSRLRPLRVMAIPQSACTRESPLRDALWGIPQGHSH